MTDPVKNNDDSAMERLLAVMARLRDPEAGCPWDVEQTHASIARYCIEEAYEVVDAIARDDLDDLKDELGDLLLQVVFHARMAQERGDFDFHDVADAISEKMRRRHPHVFDGAAARDAQSQTRAWEAQKAQERAAKGHDGLLDDVPVALPGLTRAVKLQKRAARVGFDWKTAPEILAKVEEECAELTAAVDHGDTDEIEDEFGDILFVMANLARHLKVDPETALRRANAKFTRRFAFVETALGARLEAASLEEMEAAWRAAKRAERET